MAQRSIFKPIAIGLGMAVILTVLLISIGQRGDDNQAASASPTEPQVFNTGNPQNDKLLTLSPRNQATILGQLVPDGCIGTQAFYQGMLKRTGHETTKEAQLENALNDQIGAAFWDVACTNGSSYIVEIPVDPNANSTVLSCAVAAAVGGNHCFVRFPNQ